MLTHGYDAKALEFEARRSFLRGKEVLFKHVQVKLIHLDLQTQPRMEVAAKLFLKQK